MPEKTAPPSKKKNKKKKKSSAATSSITNPSAAAPSPASAPEAAKFTNTATPSGNIQNGSKDKMLGIIDGPLPDKVGMKTVFKDVEVTLISSGSKDSKEGSSKKKKKKNKNKQPVAEKVSEEAKTTNENGIGQILNFGKDRIELVNYPEISVTLTSVPEPAANSDSTTSSKKKKKKKKKAANALPLEVEVNGPNKVEPPAGNNVHTKTETLTEEITVKTEPVPEGGKPKKNKKKKKKKLQESVAPLQEATNLENQSVPTYISVPQNGKTVLIVSHENFGAPVKSEPCSVVDSSSSTVLLKNKDCVNFSKYNLKPEIGPGASDLGIESIPMEEPKPLEACIASGLEKARQIIHNEDEKGDAQKEEVKKDEAASEETKTKAQLKAERRAKQEAQRALKAAKNPEKDSAKDSQQKQPEIPKKPTPNEAIPSKESLPVEALTKSSKSHSSDREVFRKAQVFSHLPQYQAPSLSDFHAKIHPAILELGSRYCQGTLCGSNSRCVGFLAAFREVILDYKTPAGKNLQRDLEAKLQSYLNYLNSCRPLSVSVLNAVKVIKQQINHISENIDEETAKSSLINAIETFAEVDVLLAMKAICLSATEKIVDGDTIMVFAYSSLVKEVLCTAHSQQKSFHVIVVDSRPLLEGREMLRRLVERGLSCSYVMIGSAAYVMKKVTKLIIGAHALLSNGFVMSRLGCKQLSLIAATFSVPVLVCCETHKFWERALTDSFVHNEIANPDDLVTTGLSKNDSLQKWRDIPNLQIYNILYDVTPSHLISVVITEKGLLPCTSVPVVLRVKHAGSKLSGTN